MTVKETTEYDNFVGKKVKIERVSLFDGDEDEVLSQPKKEWETQWKGMPTYIQNENKPFKQLILSFRNEEDYNAFAKLIDQNLTPKTKSIWYPKLEPFPMRNFLWVEEGEEE